MANLNDRARAAMADVVAGEGAGEIEAVLPFSHLSGGYASSGGVVGGGSSILGTAYARQLGIDLDDPRLRADLLQSWCAITPTSLVFCAPSQWSIRPKPGKYIGTIARAGTTLRWADIDGLSTVTRLIHLEFPDEFRLLTGTLVRARIRRKNYNDEPDLFVQAFGADATEIALP